MTTPIKIDVWSDVACPWCYIGKRNLETGLAAFAEDEDAPSVDIEYHSFQLAPETPVDFDGTQIDYLVRRKGISEDQVRAMNDRVTGVALAAGLHYDMGAIRPTNTLNAHQLLHYAKTRDRQVETKERLLRAHFVEGRHLGRIEDLADLAAEVGLDRDDVVRSLEADEYLGDVQADIAQARAYGINGVPFFVIDARYGISGAQPPEAFAAALNQIAAERDEEVVSS